MSIAASDTALVQAATWGQHLTSGSLATLAATIAVAGLGYALIAGRLELRRAARIVGGCFLLFSAQAIVAEFTSGVGDQVSVGEGGAVNPLVASEVAPVTPELFDPYAGAAVAK